MDELTKSGVKSAESQPGVRYSILMALPYFDPIRFTAIDSMHNLFLGTESIYFPYGLKKVFCQTESLRIR